MGAEALASWLVEQIKTMKGNRSKASILKAIAPLQGDDKPRYERLVREACGNDDAISARVLPFARLLRLDPRDLPVAYAPGSLYLTSSAARANTGAVYTPRFLAEQVVETTLEAIVYSPGPLDTEDKAAWVLKTPEQILAQKVCDIAAGSGAFLVAATRYLADRLLESRRHYAGQAAAPEESEATTEGEGVEPAVHGLRELARAEQDELDARRAVIVNCIYGVDINPMAIEMAKLSLWLTSLDRNRPFSFLDDHLLVGDSLLGVSDPRQLIDLHLDPKEGRALHRDTLDLFTSTVESDLKAASELRTQIPLVGDRDSRDAQVKQRLLRRARHITSRLSLVGDGLAAASLAGGSDSAYLKLASLVSEASNGRDPEDQKLGAHIAAGLRREVGKERHEPAHLVLAFPEVFGRDRPGFDAIIGNPPFLGGGKISGAVGTAYREHLAIVIARGKRAKRPDLVAFFLLRGEEVAATTGVVGLLATSSLSQGDTREIGLDQVTQTSSIYAATRSQPWPTASAAVEYVFVCLARPALSPCRRYLDGTLVTGITPTLDPASRVAGAPSRLIANKGRAYQGSVLHGSAFILEPEKAETLLADAENAAVVKPFLTGDDVNSTAERRPTRYALDFGVMSEEQASRYVLAWEYAEAYIKPERELLRGRAGYERIVKNWWQYWAPRRELYRALAAEGSGVCLALTSTTLAPVPAPLGVVFSHALGVVCGPVGESVALISSDAHFCWVLRYKSTMGRGLRYSLTDLYETFPRPAATTGLEGLGLQLDALRRDACLARGVGLTSLHRLLQSSDGSADLMLIRAKRQEIDGVLMNAYGWSDLDVEMCLLETDLGLRWTAPQEVQIELLDRLLEANHERHAAEVTAGLHSKDAKKATKRQPSRTSPERQVLFGADG